MSRPLEVQEGERFMQRSRRPVVRAACAGLLLFCTAAAWFEKGRRPPTARPGRDEPARASVDMARAAANLWDALDEEQRQAAVFGFESDERHNFHFVPRERKGLPWARMTATQRLL